METLGFGDILGPVMVGPSSSHTAGALRIARMARRLVGSQPAKVTFTLYMSFAHTGRGHGTDKALIAGMLDFNTDDLRIRDSYELAREAGMDVEVIFDTQTETSHPNTVDIEAIDAAGRALRLRGVSVGGGAVSIRNIDGIDVDITGEHTSLVTRQTDAKGVLAHIAQCVADAGVNIATTRMFREHKGQIAYTVMEIDAPVHKDVCEAILAHPDIHEVRVIPAMVESSQKSGAEGNAIAAGTGEAAEASAHEYASYADAEQLFQAYDFTCGAELLALCAREKASIGTCYRMREVGLSAVQREISMRNAARELDEYCTYVLDVMRESAIGPVENPQRSMGGLIGGEAQAVARAEKQLVDNLTQRAMTYAMAVLETNACMGRIVAAPTAGSAGVVPSVLLALTDKYGYSREQLVEALHCAAAVGTIIARNASVSGAQGGCQAEVGAACGMAAAAEVQLAGGTPAQCLDAAANALMCLMGLVCDPVRGLVEVPCQKRNASAAATALVCAQMALAGIENLVPFDEAVAALDAVGKSLPFELRESALGGIAACKSACRLVQPTR